MNRRRPGLMLLAACLAALALRVLVPAGWMPAEGSRGMVLALCSGTAITLDEGGAPLPVADPAPCAFALATGPALLAAALLLPPLALPLLPPLPLAPVAVVSRRHRVRPPGQGPPRI